jgi:hypothetical protein
MRNLLSHSRHPGAFAALAADKARLSSQLSLLDEAAKIREAQLQARACLCISARTVIALTTLKR